MRYFILDVVDKILNEEEAERYYFKHFMDMSKIEIKPYLQNKEKYIHFFYDLFNISKKAVIKVSPFAKNYVKKLVFTNKKYHPVIDEFFILTQKIGFVLP